MKTGFAVQTKKAARKLDIKQRINYQTQESFLITPYILSTSFDYYQVEKHDTCPT